jgi:hypothetical protein
MNSTDSDVLSGQIAGLASTMAAIISTLPPVTAAQTALQLVTSREQDRENDLPGTEGMARTRDSFVEAFLGLLSAVALRRE